MIQLHLATPLTDYPTPTLYIPALIADENEKYIEEQIKKFRENENSVGFHYSFQKINAVSGLYNKMLSKLASKEVFHNMKNPGITFHKCFSAKIENRKLGVVGGLHGSFKWTTDEASPPEIVEFLVLEKDCDNSEKNFKFARHKVN